MATHATKGRKPVLLVTGSSGLIGERVAREFRRDFTLVGLDQKPPRDRTDIDFIACDLTRDDDTARALRQVRERHGDEIASVIHLAAYYDFSGEPSPLYRQLTVEGTGRLLRELSAFTRVEQFIFTSTLLVMEPAEEGETITESSPLEDDPWEYPRSKIETERLIAAEHGDIPALILRIAGVYDAEGHSLPIGQHIARIHEKQPESYFFPGNPQHGTPYVHLEDLMDCFRRAVDRRHELPPLATLLVAEPDLVRHEELQELIGERIHGKEWPSIRIPRVAAKAGAWAKERIGEGPESFVKPWMVDLADAHYPVAIGRAGELLGWRPRHRLRDTLPRIIRRLKADPRGFYAEHHLPLPHRLRRDEMDACPPGFDYNPSSWRQRIPICILAMVAFVIATYMSLYQWRLLGSAWDPVFGGQTQEVLDSSTSETMRRWLRIPDGALGAIAYLGDAIFGLAGSTRRWQYRPWLVILFGIDVVPLGIVSAVLVVMQGAVVGAWCFLCLVTALISLILVYFAYDEVWATIQYLRRVWRKTHDWSVMWKTFWGRPVPEAEEVALQS